VISLACADGVSLEAELRLPDDAWAATVLLHPHPKMGGTMRVGLPSFLFDALPAAGVAALRFNFRGVEGSGGSHGRGVDERLDVVSAIDSLSGVVPAGVPLVLCGWSFGGDVSLSVAHDRVAGWFAVAAPLRVFPSASDYVAADDPRPKVLAVPQHDQYCDPACARESTSSWVATSVEVVPGADHFMAGRMDRVATMCLSFLEGLRG
jgi:alpha/beta superfamily hydrolase